MPRRWTSKPRDQLGILGRVERGASRGVPRKATRWQRERTVASSPAEVVATSTSACVCGGGSSRRRSSAFWASWFSHSASAITTAARQAALAGAQPQCVLERADLSDPHPCVVGAALHPQEVRVVADVAVERSPSSRRRRWRDLVAGARASAEPGRLRRAGGDFPLHTMPRAKRSAASRGAAPGPDSR